MKYSPSRMFSLAKHMIEVMEDRTFQAYIVFGPKGRGKSTYAIKAVAQFYHVYRKLPYDEAFREALNSIAFTVFDVLSLIDEGRQVIIWDDAGVWLSTYMWFDEAMQEYLRAFMDYYDVIRTDASVIVFTTPSKQKLPPRVRNDPSAILVRVSKAGTRVERTESGERRWQLGKAEAASNQESLYDDKPFRQPLWIDYFVVKLPDEVFQAYMEKRQAYAEYAKKRLVEIVLRTFGNPTTLESMIKHQQVVRSMQRD